MVHSRSIPLILALCSYAVVVCPANAQLPFLGKPFSSTQIASDVVYGTGMVDVTTSPSSMNLTCDTYIPSGAGVPPLVPAIILVHGGAYIIGDKASPPAESSPGSGDFGTTMGTYAPEFARRGYVAISINYRMILDDPDGTGLLTTGGASLTGIVAVIQALISGSVTVPDAQVERAIEAAVADTGKAYDYLVANKDAFLGSHGFSIDTSRIAVGGWSAGGFIAHDFAYAVPSKPVRAVWSNSAGMENRSVFITNASQPPSIMFHGDADTIVNVSSTRDFDTTLESIGVPHQYYEMVGDNHYYLSTRPVFETAAKAGPGTTVDNLVGEFFFTHMDLLPLAIASSAVPASSNSGNALLVVFVVIFATIVMTGYTRIRYRKNA